MLEEKRIKKQKTHAVFIYLQLGQIGKKQYWSMTKKVHKCKKNNKKKQKMKKKASEEWVQLIVLEAGSRQSTGATKQIYSFDLSHIITRWEHLQC